MSGMHWCSAAFLFLNWLKLLLAVSVSDGINFNIPSYLHPDARAKYASALHLLVELRHSTFWAGVASIPVRAVVVLGTHDIGAFVDKSNSCLNFRQKTLCYLRDRKSTRLNSSP